CFLDKLAVRGDHAEAAAALNIQIGEVKCHQMQHAPIDDHELVMIANQVISGPGDSHAGSEHPQLESSQVLVTPFIRASDQSLYSDATRHCVRKRLFYLLTIKTKNDDLDASLRFFDPFNKGPDAVTRLNEKPHQNHLAPILQQSTLQVFCHACEVHYAPD